MKMTLRYALVVFASLFCFQCFAQTQNWREKYQVKKKDTLYGIAKKYNISVDALIEASPEMKVDGFELEKGSYVCIPLCSLWHVGADFRHARAHAHANCQSPIFRQDSKGWRNASASRR